MSNNHDKQVEDFNSKVAAALKSLSDCSALRDMEGFADEVFDLADEIRAYAESLDWDEDRLYFQVAALREASAHLYEMQDQYTEAHLALTRATEV